MDKESSASDAIPRGGIDSCLRRSRKVKCRSCPACFRGAGDGNCGLRGNLLPKDSSCGSGRRLADQAQPPPTRSHRPKGQAIERPFIGLPWIGPFSSHFVARQPRHPPRFGFSYIFSSNKNWLSWPPLHSVQVAHYEARCRRGRGSVGSGAGQAGDLCGPLSAQD